MDNHYRGILLGLFLLISFGCKKMHQDTNKYNLAYDIGAIPQLDNFLKYNISERRMDSALLSSYREVKKYGYMADSGTQQKEPDTIAIQTLYKQFRDNRGRVYINYYANGKAEDHYPTYKTGLPMECRCYLHKDSLMVQMAAGFFGGFGFTIRIGHDKFDLVYFEEESGGYFFKTSLTDTAFADAAFVNSKYQTLVLDQKPAMKAGQQLTGFASYTSAKYYLNSGGNKLDTTYVTGKIYFTCQTGADPGER